MRSKKFEKLKQVLYQNIPEEEANQQLVNLVNQYGIANVLLWSSAPTGDMASVTQAINDGADVNIEIGGKGSPMLGAAQAGSLEIVKLLISKGADPNKRTTMGATALSIAVSKNNIEMVDLLIDAGANFTRGGDPGHKEFSILTVALASKQIKMVEHLLKRGANPNGGSGLPLAFAIMMKNTKSMELLIKKGANVNFSGKNGFRPLMTAVVEGDKEVISLLLKHGADPKQKDNQGLDAFAWAKKYKSKGAEVLKSLLEKKAK
jgi:ankyrin repeat protein